MLGADPEVHEGWTGPYDVDTTFHEPFVLFGYLAAITSLELVTGIIILPQRQTALVAKQAAEVDLLTERPVPLRHRHRLEPRSSTRRSARTSPTAASGAVEQVELLRRLWTERTVTTRATTSGSPAPASPRCPYSGRSRSGSAPSPRRPTAEPAGWPTAGSPRSPRARTLDEARAIVRVRRRRGRPRPRRRSAWRAGSSWGAGGLEQLVDHVGRWRDAGATHSRVNTMGAGLGDLDGHLGVLAEVATALHLTKG